MLLLVFLIFVFLVFIHLVYYPYCTLNYYLVQSPSHKMKKYINSINYKSRKSNIPKVIYQTYKTDVANIPIHLYTAHLTWIEKNPDYTIIYMDDNQIDTFIKTHFDEKVYSVFKALPVGVMKADFFRYAVIYINGGIYTDMDTECKQPAHEWIPNDVDAVINLENDDHLCQWTFAFSPKHPLLKHVIDTIVQQCLDKGIDTTHPHYIHETTGPAIWTRAIKDYLIQTYGNHFTNNVTTYTAKDIFEHYKNVDKHLIIYPQHMFSTTAVHHNFAYTWKQPRFAMDKKTIYIN